MASTNKTANLDLSQFVGSDKPDWLTDYNGDMLKIDNSIGDVSASAEVAARNAQIAADNAASAITKADAAVEQIGGIVDTVTRAEEVADRAESVANNALTVANNTASLASDAVGLANDALAKAASAKTQAESAVASAGEAVTTANAAKTVADAAADDVAGAVDAANAATAAVNAMDGRVGDIEDVIPDNASASNKLVTAADIPGGVSVDSALNAASNNPVTNAAITTAINAENSRLDDIEALIPSSASASNQLATMADVGGGGVTAQKISEASGNGTLWRSEVIRNLVDAVSDWSILTTRQSYILYRDENNFTFKLNLQGSNSAGNIFRYGAQVLQLPQLLDAACKGVAIYFSRTEAQMASVIPSGTVSRLDNQVAATNEKWELYIF